MPPQRLLWIRAAPAVRGGDDQVGLGAADQILYHAPGMRAGGLTPVGTEPVMAGEEDVVACATTRPATIDPRRHAIRLDQHHHGP